MHDCLPAADQLLLQRAITLAEGAIGVSEPNPRVGCVIHDAQGRLAGEGHTQQAGGPHAEVMALRAAREAGIDVSGGTAWVSLEPCAHHGRTPPCADALVAAGIARVVVALHDPFPQVCGQGIARLRAAGVRVDIAPEGPVTAAARALNIGFLSRVLRGRPWVRLKVAASLDARTALPDGRSQWITGPVARADGHAWRRRAGAVLTGIGTVRDDDPRLDVREVPTLRQPRRVVLDSRFATPPTARLLSPPADVLVVGAVADAPRQAALQAAGARTLLLPGQDGRVDLPALLRQLGSEGINELHVEAGAVLNGAWLAADLVDELLVYLAPKLLGPGRDIAMLPALPSLDEARGWRFIGSDPVGVDLRLRLMRQGADAFLG
ncbi:bifunctional diaminohydroxyphosphoribosylaminopyrimidine deaminase/5-amino-6-(5-phosphoribosylamino)uracil reductase RibD [Ideonella sp. DXS22W]|uniref:Riboflavin biosynthesis protein RibD n=1 Tax=Pseudaquabacterium inlustre TaxID=2984192 RepID=A0ABU9CE78_9BURK